MNPQLLQELFAPSTSEQHTQALESLQSLRDSPVAWKSCAITLATSGSTLDDKSKFICLQVLEHYAKSMYATAPDEDQMCLRQNISNWLTSACQSSEPEKVFIRNKAAQVLALIFVVDYVAKWPTFIEDLIALQDQGPNAIDIFLRTLLSIDAEIVDRDTLHSQVETERNTIIKDTLRERSVANLANSWHNILVKYPESNPVLVCHCHDVIGAYISWIDINIIANDRFVSLLVSHLKESLLRESAADCIIEILLKGMDPLAKTQLIESFYTVLDEAGVFKMGEEDEDGDYLVKLSKLINCIGVQLISSWNKIDKKDTVNREHIRLAVENKLHLLLVFMAHEDEDVSAVTFDFARDYIQMLKQLGTLTEIQKAQLENMLFVIITKTKYDESYNFKSEGEEEAMFVDYRKNLKIVFDNLAALVPDLVMRVCKDFFTTILNRWQMSSYIDVECAISLLFNLGEAIPSNGSHFTNAQGKTNAIGEMMRLLLSSGVCAHEHPAVALQFFECVSRYEKFFASEVQFIPSVLAAFLDHRGVRNKSIKVRSRTTYLFLRFVRCQKIHLVRFTEQILEGIEDLLILCPTEAGKGAPILSNDDQLYVYEAASILIVGSSISAPQKEVLMRKVLSSVASRVAELMHRLANEPLPVKQLAIATNMCHAISVTARTSKAFSNQNTMKSCGCVLLYVEMVQTFISCLNIGYERDVIGSGLRQLMHRLVVCLDREDLASVLPAASQALLFTPSMDALLEYLPLISQVVVKYKKDVAEFVNGIFPPLMSAILEKLQLKLDPMEEEEIRTQKSLQKNYFLFLNSLVSHGLLDIFSRQDPALIQQVLHSTVHGAVEYSDPTSQKACFFFLKKLTEVWGDKELGPPLYIEFLYSQVVPACFLAPLKCDFDLNDAQSLLALYESGQCMQTIYAQRGDEFLAFLRTDFFPKKNLPPEIVEEYCHAVTSDAKLFKNYIKYFYQRVKL